MTDIALNDRRQVRRAASAVLVLVAALALETTGSSMTGGDRVRLHWDWATDVKPQASLHSSPARAQRTRVPLVTDFTSRHVIFPEVVPAKLVNVVQNDWRFQHQYLRRHAHRYVPLDPDYVPVPWLTQQVARDWSFSLNNGNGGTIGFPAKYVFDVNAVPSCTNDFVVTGVNIAGSATQANVIAFNSLYNTPAGNGLCAGTAPKVLFSYNVGPGVLNSYIALSLDGTKIAFNENNGANSYFHVLKWATGAGNGTSAGAPAVPGSGNTAADVKLPLPGGTSTAPYVDYETDTAYITTSDNVIHKFTGVFTGTPAEVNGGGSGWPAASGTGGGISTPVLDPVTRHVFFTDSGNGGIDYVDDSVVPAVVYNNKFYFAPGLSVAAPVVIDVGNQKVFGFSSNSGGTNAVVGQADTNLSAASQVTVSVGSPSSNLAPLMGDMNDDYYNGVSASARLYVVGNNSTTNKVPALYAIGFNASFKMNAAYSNGPLALATNTAGIGSSPVTAFFNTTLNKQFLFVGITNRCSASITGGCIRSIDVTGGAFPTAATINNVILAATGGTSGITVDNVSASAGASSVYYTTLTGKTIVKATQAGLQ